MISSLLCTHKEENNEYLNYKNIQPNPNPKPKPYIKGDFDPTSNKIIINESIISFTNKTKNK